MRPALLSAPCIRPRSYLAPQDGFRDLRAELLLHLSLHSAAWLKPAAVLDRPAVRCPTASTARAASGAAALGGTGDDEPRCFVICLFLPVHYQCITKSVQPSQIARLGLRGVRGLTRPQVRAR